MGMSQLILVFMFSSFFFVVVEPARSQRMKCGKSSISSSVEGFVLGGDNADQGVWPWMVALMEESEDGKEKEGIQNDFRCSGSLIDKKHVLTAAHCFDGKSASVYSALIGNVDLRQSQSYSIERIAIPVGYKEGLFYDDIAMLTLSREVDLPNFSPICLPPKNALRNLTGKGTTVSGWGATARGGPTSTLLKQLTGLPVLSNSVCDEAYGRKFDALPRGIDSRMLCAGFDKGDRRDTCQGDSGGPLMIREGNRWYAVGLVSFGLSCGRPDYPGVYTRVSGYLNWINAQRDMDKKPPSDPPSQPDKPKMPIAPSRPSGTECGTPVVQAAPGSKGNGATLAGEFPWTVSLAIVTEENTLLVSCNGVLLDSRTVLTLAYCVHGSNDNPHALQFGIHNKWSGDRPPVEVRRKYRIVIHPDFNEVTNDNNIALLKLDSDLQYTDLISPVCLPTKETAARDLAPGSEGTVSGWQFTDESYIRKRRLTVQSNADCLKSNFEKETRSHIGPDMFCTKWLGKWFWNGSPFVFRDPDTGRYILEGLVSHFLGYTNDGKLYQVFLKVSHFLDWIEENRH